MYTHILVPNDGSPTSDRGLQEAVNLARLTGARLRLVRGGEPDKAGAAFDSASR